MYLGGSRISTRIDDTLSKLKSTFLFIQKIITDTLTNKGHDKYLDHVDNHLDWIRKKFDYNARSGSKRPVKRGEIYYCDLGMNIGSEQNKIRPAIILQNNTGNKYSTTSVVAPISKVKKPMPFHVNIKNVQNSSKTKGYILLEQIRVVEKCRLGICIEYINPRASNWKIIDEALKKFLDIL